MNHFCLVVFKMCSLSLVLRSLWYVLMWISLGLSYVDFAWLLKSVGLDLSPNLGSFSAPHFSPYFWNSDTNVSSFVIPKILRSLFNFFFYFSLCYSDGINFIDLSIQVNWFYPVISTLEPFKQGVSKLLLFYFSVLRFLFLFLWLLLLCWDFLFFSLVTG